MATSLNADASRRSFVDFATMVGRRGCGEIGRRARFRFWWGKTRVGSSPITRIQMPAIRHDKPLDRLDSFVHHAILSDRTQARVVELADAPR